MTTPTVSNVTGTVAEGNTLTVTGTGMVQQDSSSWITFFSTNHTNAVNLEGTLLSNMGFDEGATARDGNYTLDTAAKVIGTHSLYNNTTGQVRKGGGFDEQHGAAMTVGSASDMGYSGVTTDLWWRIYLKIDQPGGEYPSQVGGSYAADHKIFWYTNNNDFTKGFWLSWDYHGNTNSAAPTALTLTPSNYGNIDTSAITFIPNVWHCIELKAPLDTNNKNWQVYFDNEQVYSDTLADGIDFHDPAHYEFLTNWFSTSASFDQDLWVDSPAIKNNSRVRPVSVVELADGSTYATANKVYCHPTSTGFSETSSLIRVPDLSSLTGSTATHLFVTNNAGEVSAAYSLSGGGGGAQRGTSLTYFR